MFPIHLFAFFHLRCTSVRCILFSLKTRQGRRAPPGVAHFGVEPERAILKGAANRGFAFVSEASCEALLLDMHHDVPVPDGDAPDRKTELAFACMKAIEPDWTDVQALHALNRAFLLENPDTYSDLRTHTKHVEEVVTNVERQKVQDYHSALSQIRATKKAMRQTRKSRVHEYFKKSKMVTDYEKAPKQPIPRWLPAKNPRTKAVTTFIQSHMPTDVKLVEDEYNGRWRVIAPDNQWKSIFWTKRGYKEASALTLSKAWEFQEDHCGIGPAWSMDLLMASFVEAE